MKKEQHGRSRTPEYRNWLAMKARCNYPNAHKYADYGGRGIKVCERWNHSFANFFADMGTRPTPRAEIDRKDNNGHYEPDNCRWSNRKQQNNNKRDTCFVTIDGETLSLKAWCVRLGRNYNSVAGRVFQYGWEPKRALLEPPRWYRRRKDPSYLPPQFEDMRAAVETLDEKVMDGGVQ